MVINMSFTQRLIKILEAGIHKFIPLHIGANRSYPYHDYETATLTATYVRYNVGENNQKGNGSQSKLFVSKSTLIYATQDADIKLNNSENVEIDILSGILYNFESDISSIFYK